MVLLNESIGDGWCFGNMDGEGLGLILGDPSSTIHPPKILPKFFVGFVLRLVL